MEALVWEDEELGAKWTVQEIPADLVDQAEEYRAELIETIASVDEAILEKFVGEEEITVDDLRQALRRATIANDLVPILNGTAFKNKGVQPLLDAVVDYLPSPLDLPPTQGMNLKGDETLERKASDDEPFAALAFKIMTAPDVGKLTYFRVYSGQPAQGRPGPQQPHPVQGAPGSRARDARQPPAGPRRRSTPATSWPASASRTPRPATPCAPSTPPIVLEELEFPEPVIHVAVEPKTKADQDKMSKALFALSEEDPTFQVRSDEETGQTVISGMGELHLEVLVDRMLREFRVDATVGKPQVAYRETISQKVDKSTYTHKKQTGGSGQYAEVTIAIENTGPGGGYEFVDAISGGRIPKEYIPSVDAGIQDAMTAGVLAGYPTVDVRATLIDGKYHDVDSSEMAFKIAGTMAFKEAARKAKPILLEPIMKVEVVTPDDYMGDVMGDLSSRRGKLGGMEQRGSSQVINAQVPLSEMFGYATDLRSRTQGRATYTMQFDSYQQMPSSVQEEIVTRVRGE